MSESTVVSTSNAPAAVGPYSQARWAGDFLYLSGQIGLVPESGEMVSGGVEEQATQVMNNMGQVLAAAGLGWEHIVKTTIFLTDMGDFAAVNQVYANVFSQVPELPARACVQVSALPKGALVEVEAIALKSS